MTSPLDGLLKALAADPGLRAETSAAQIAKGIAAAQDLSDLLVRVIGDTHVNDDGLISAADLKTISAAIYAKPADYVRFLEAHGNDNGDVVSGFHYIQNDGGTLEFRGRAFIDTVADAIFHYGFKITDGRYVNEDGATNETTRDVAGWLNYFLNGESVVLGTAGRDELGTGDYSDVFAAARNESFLAGDGDDKIWAGDGDDKVMGGDGNDTSGGDVGNDRLYGEAGRDSLYGDTGNDALYGGAGADELGGGNGRDLIDGGADDDMAGGGAGADRMTGGAGDDSLGGEDGADRLQGGEGADALSGGAGADRIDGDAGRDDISGGEGADTITGGTGGDTITLWESAQSADTIVFAAGDAGRSRATIDHIEGFESGIDKIRIEGAAGMSFEDLDYRGGGAKSCYFDGHYLRLDMTGDAVTDMIIELQNVESLARGDLVFA